MIELSPPQYNPKEIFRESDSFENYGSLIKSIKNFEISIQKELKTDQKILSTSSGTSALHLAVKLAGICKGDYVICQTHSFIASVNPVLYERAIPIFVDSEPDTWNICPDLLETAIVDLYKSGIRPKALIVTHIYGRPARMNDILAICQTYDIKLIEDSAEALGSFISGKATGTLGNYGVISFNYNKIISSGGGGALICKEPTDYKKAKYLATQAKSNKIHYEHKELGFNYLMGHLNATVGVKEIQMLQKRIDQRTKLQAHYAKIIRQYSNWKIAKYPCEFGTSNNWLISLENSSEFDVETLVKNFFKNGIETRPIWYPLHLQPLLKKYKSYVNGISEKLFKTVIHLPSSVDVHSNSTKQIEIILNKLLA